MRHTLLLALLFVAAALPARCVPTFKGAAVAYDPAWGDLNGNIQRMAQALDTAGRSGVKLAVFPEQATIGDIFDDFKMVRPYLDTVPGKTTAALSAVTRKYHMYAAVGVAEIDPSSGLGYNTAVLVGPQGYIGRYRKHGLNPQDQRWVAPGNEGFPVFDTELGRLTMLICYDDTYWQYARMASLHDVDVICWLSSSDRDMPDLPAASKKGDHSTVANVQYLSVQNGAWVIAATRNGIERNPKTGQQLYYNGGSSIWNPSGQKVAQAPVLPPKTLSPGVHGVITADIAVATARSVRARLLARRRTPLYQSLALHRAPTDGVATRARHEFSATAVAWTKIPARLPQPSAGGIVVLPELFSVGIGQPAETYRKRAEPINGPSEQTLIRLAAAGGGLAVGSYPERSGSHIYHTVALASGTAILARYRATHLPPSQTAWATPGDQWVVAVTPIGRIGLALGEELAVPEVAGVLSFHRADLVAAPSGLPEGPLVQLDPKLFNHPYPVGTPFAPFAAAHLGQFWLVSSGWRQDLQRQAAAVYGPEPVIATPPQVPAAGQDTVTASVTVPWAGTWINQQQLIDGQQPWATIPLVLDMNGAAFKRWRARAGWVTTW